MSDPHDHVGDPLGSAAEEAARLFAAVSGWARDQAADVGEHLATDAAECTYCPICRTVHLLREVTPEVREHLSTAASSLFQAALGLVAAASSAAAASGRASTSPGAARATTVEHIDLDADLDADSEERGGDEGRRSHEDEGLQE